MYRLKFVEMEDSNHSVKPSSNGVAEGEHPEKCNQSSEEFGSPQTEERSQAYYEDTASKTIDFLRARLLAERATSKAAKDSAEQNAKRLMELERMIEIETEKRKKAEAAMQEVMAKLKVGCLLPVSDHIDSDRTRMEKQTITEERLQVEDGCSSNSTCNALTEEGQLVKVDLNNDILQEDGDTLANSAQSEFLVKREDDSSTLKSDNAKTDVFSQNSSSIGDQGQMPNQLETVDNGIVSSSPLLCNPGENFDSMDHDKSLNENNQNEEGSSYQGPVATESFSEGKITINTRVKLQEKFGKLCDQIGNGVASLGGEDQKEFLRVKLHELVDEIVGTNKNNLHKCEKCTLHTSNNCSKLSALDTYMQQKINQRNSKGPNLQMEVPYGGPNMIDGLREDESFDSRSEVSSQCQTDRAPAPCIEKAAVEWHENVYGHGTFCCDLGCNLCKCQSCDLDDRFLDGNEKPGRNVLVENTMHVSSCQRQLSNTQVPLGNVKADIAKNLQCKSFPVLQSDASCEGFHLKMECLADRTTNHDKLYCNHENAKQVRRNCHHNQAAVSMELRNPMELTRVSGSDGLMPWNHDLHSSQNTSYLMKCQNPESRVYQGMDNPLKRVESLPQRNCHNYLPLQSEESPKNVSNSNRITRCTKAYSDYEFAPLVSMRCASRGTKSGVTELPKMPRGQVGDVLIALRHAKKQIQSSIEVRKNSRALWS